MSDTIIIKDLVLSCAIGYHDEERKEKQRVIITITLFTDLFKSGKTDMLSDSVNYKELYLAIVKDVEESSYHLLEALAEHIARRCLSDERVKKVEVAVEKPGALKLARSAKVVIVREHA